MKQRYHNTTDESHATGVDDKIPRSNPPAPRKVGKLLLLVRHVLVGLQEGERAPQAWIGRLGSFAHRLQPLLLLRLALVLLVLRPIQSALILLSLRHTAVVRLKGSAKEILSAVWCARVRFTNGASRSLSPMHETAFVARHCPRM